MSKTDADKPAGYIIRPYITLKNGRRIYAAHYGKKGFVIPIDPNYDAKKRTMDS